MHLRHVIGLAAAALLAACGGGGDPEPLTSTTSDEGPTTEQISCGLSNFESEALQRINQARAAGATCGAHGSFGPAPSLAWNDRLASAAYSHSIDMANNNFLSHTGSGGTNVGTRVTAAGYDWRAVGENLAGGPGSIASVIDGWLASPDHCANLMNPVYQHVALACVAREGTEYGRYWTMVLAAPR